MQVIKRDGRIQEFQIEKIKTSIRNTAADIKEFLSTKDVNTMAGDVEKKIEALRGKEGKTSVFEIRVLTAHAIDDYGYNGIAKHYVSGCLE